MKTKKLEAFGSKHLDMFPHSFRLGPSIRPASKVGNLDPETALTTLTALVALTALSAFTALTAVTKGNFIRLAPLSLSRKEVIRVGDQDPLMAIRCLKLAQLLGRGWID